MAWLRWYTKGMCNLSAVSVTSQCFIALTTTFYLWFSNWGSQHPIRLFNFPKLSHSISGSNLNLKTVKLAAALKLKQTTVTDTFFTIFWHEYSNSYYVIGVIDNYWHQKKKNLRTTGLCCNNYYSVLLNFF